MFPSVMSLKRIFLILFICVTTFDKQVNGQFPVFFRSDYKYDNSSQAFYKQHNQMKKWGEAVYECELEGAELAAPVTEEDTRALVNQMKNCTNGVFVGIHDMFEEGNFITLNGTPIADTFLNWINNKPSAVYSNDDCVTLSPTGLYSDVRCDLTKKFICKKDLRTLTINPICETYDTEYFHSSITNNCYKLHKSPKTWYEAYKICIAEQSYLGILNSPEEAAVYLNATKLSPEYSSNGNIDKFYLHLGFNALLIPGSYRTIYAQSLSSAGYNVWVSSHDKRQCGAINMEGKLTSQYCSLESMFICEKTLKAISLNSISY